MADSPDSPLSSLSSVDFGDDMKLEEPAHAPIMATPRNRTLKRRRTRNSGWDGIISLHDDIRASSPVSSISSDTSHELPDEPDVLALIGGTVEDDYSGVARDQVTACQWDGCHVGDLGDMDSLVKHIHEEHIGPKHKKYLCEWMNCTRKGQSHASGYALRAHIRSHTKEKPFYCSLPECDRSFTRSDALTKHMRTVHEAEALRPFDVVPQNTVPTSTQKAPRMKLKLNQPSAPDGERSSSTTPAAASATETNNIDGPLPSELGFDEREQKLPLQYLYRLLLRQIIWAEREGEELRQNSVVIERLRQEAWKEKEELLTHVLKAEEQFQRTHGVPPERALSHTHPNGPSDLARETDGASLP
ncbi:hypothetical protein KEM56_002820 [Ascosphaera pollenicola]|nr:hypothetical protein KEM56_002820 [Ascosphaera pollenicola]